MNMNLTNNLTNSSTAAPPALLGWGLKDLAHVVVLSLCFFIGFPGNVAVLILRPNWQQLSRLTQCLMMNLALSDLLCLVTLPVWIYTFLYSWTLGVVTCKIVAFIVACSVNSSLLTIAGLSVQRYIQVVHPLRCLQVKKRLFVLMWLISMVLSIPALLFRNTIKKEGHWSMCLKEFTTQTQEVAVLLTECFVGFSSLIITTFAYIFMNRKLSQAVYFNNTSTFRLVTTIIVTFFVLWTPYLTFNLVIVGGILSNNTIIINNVDYLVYILRSVSYINSSINPLLYAFSLGIFCKKKPVTDQ